MKSERKVPELRFPGFSGEWEEKRLGDIAEVLSSTRVYAKDYVDEGIPFYRGREISELKKGVVSEDLLYISEEHYERLKKDSGVPLCGDILITAVGTLGNCYLLRNNKPFYFKDGNIIWLKEITEEPAFIEQYINSNKGYNKILSLANGSNQKALTIVGIKSMFISFPSRAEQTKIGNFFHTLDERIELQQKEIENLEEEKKWIMQKIFSQEIRFKDEYGNDYPEWEEKKFKELGSFYNGLSGKTKADFIEGDAKYITYMNVFKNTISDLDMIDFVKINNGERQNKVNYGDILFTQSSETIEEIGMSSVWLGKNDCYLNSFCFGFRFNSLKNINPIYIGYLLRSNEMRKKIIMEGQGSTRYNLASSRLANVKLILPTISEQQKIANFLSTFDNKIEKEKEKLEQFKELKNGLLQKMFV